MSYQSVREKAKKTKMGVEMGVNDQSKKMEPVYDWPRVVEMGGSRTPRPHKWKRRCTTGISDVLFCASDPHRQGSFSVRPLVLDDA